MKKVFTLFLSLAMISSLSVGAYANENEDLPMNTFPITEDIMEKINKEQPAIDAYKEINMGLGIVDPSHPAFPNYPDNFSGAYYADEKLHLCLTENSPQTQMEYAALVSDPSVLVFETANYSYNDLYEGARLIADEASASFSSISVDVYDNAISVGLPFQQTTLQSQSVVSKIAVANTSSLPISYTYEEKASASATEIRGGQKITWSESDGPHFGTIAICGTWQGANAILTAGHCVFVDTTYKLSGTAVGVGAYSQYNTDQFYDYGVIKYTGGTKFTTSNKVLNNANATTITSTLSSSSGLVGTTVCKYGSKTYFSTGEIDKVNAIVSYGNSFLLYGMTKVIDPDFDEDTSPTIGAKGDSGGPIYSGHKLYGIYSGDASKVDDDGNITKKSDHYWYSPIYGASGFTVKTS